MDSRRLPAWMLSEDKNQSCVSGKTASNGIKYYNSALQRPLLRFAGRINYCTTAGDCGMACEEILEGCKEEGEIILGFDMEWPVICKSGSKRTALIQICASENECHLFQVSGIKNLPLSLIHLLQHPSTKLVGINIASDLWKLSRDFSITVKPIIDTKVVDLGVLANAALNCAQKWSMEGLVLNLLKMRLDKDDGVRKSNWNIQPLSEEQQIYAATDAYASLVLYQRLQLRMAGES
ncbi:3'-5' exonuclease isoform X2 [Anabrus simplex]|uniref:3'-5' exonuclease isoform X2 n=1 Tax=Anabrus simplex TaxID=316456 RepID=UPI0035A2B6CC